MGCQHSVTEWRCQILAELAEFLPLCGMLDWLSVSLTHPFLIYPKGVSRCVGLCRMNQRTGSLFTLFHFKKTKQSKQKKVQNTCYFYLIYFFVCIADDFYKTSLHYSTNTQMIQDWPGKCQSHGHPAVEPSQVNKWDDCKYWVPAFSFKIFGE